MLWSKPLVSIGGVLALMYAWILFSPELKVIIWPDSIAYLTPAADALELGYFSHWGGRGFIYPAVLWGLLRITPEPWIIVAVQRLMAFTAYLCVAATILLLGHHLASIRPATRLIVGGLAALWLFVYVTYPPAAGVAHAVGPETLGSLLLAMTVGTAVALALPKISQPQAKVLTIATVLLSSALALVRPHWQLAALVVPAMLPFIVPDGFRRVVGGFAIGSFVFSLLLFGVPEIVLQQRYDNYLSRVIGPRHLFCSNGDLVYHYLAARPDEPFSIEVTKALGRILSPEARASARDWALLGFNSDDCTHGETAHLIARHFDGRPADESVYYVMTYLRALITRPWYLATRLGRHFAELIRRPFAAVATDYWVRADDRTLSATRGFRSLFGRWADHHRALFIGIVELPSRQWLDASRVFFAGAGLLLSAAILLATLLSVAHRTRSVDRAVPAAFAITLICTLATNVLIVVVHTFEPRYIVMQLPLFVVLGFSASLMVSERLSDRRSVELTTHKAADASCP